MNRLVKLLHLRGIRRRYVLYRVNHHLAGTKAGCFEKKRRLLNSIEGFEIGEGTRIVGPVEVSGTLETGKNCWIGKNLKINGNGSVTIGDNCDIAPEVTFQTGGHEIDSAERRAGKGKTYHQTVGSGTWIGGRVTVLNSVRIGAGCVVAGCSCVIRDVPDNTLVAGVPAKTIRSLNDEYTEE